MRSTGRLRKPRAARAALRPPASGLIMPGQPGGPMPRTSSPAPALTGHAVRKSFLDFFAARGHTIVPSMSLVPGGDQTLLFTNSGMVQFKDVFLGTGTRPYSRVADR